MSTIETDAPALAARILDALAARGRDADDDAVLVARAITEAERIGSPEFGLRLLLAALDDPSLEWTPPPVETVGERAVLDASGRFAPLVLATAARLSADRADAGGLGLTVVVSPSGLGRLAPFARAIAERDLVGLVAVGSPPLVAPVAGNSAALGTNPLAAAVPSSAGAVVVDSASSELTRGRWQVLRERGEAVPEGSAIGASGHPVTDPDLVSAFLPRGGLAGMTLALVVEMLTNGAAGIPGSSRENRAAIVLALGSLTQDASLRSVGDDLRERITAAGGYVPGTRAAEADVRFAVDTEQWDRLIVHGK